MSRAGDNGGAWRLAGLWQRGGSLLLVGINQVTMLGFGVVTVLLLTHLVTPEEYGVYVVLMTLAQLGLQVSHMGWFNFAARVWTVAEDRHAGVLRFLAWTGLRRLPVLAGLVTLGLVTWALWQGNPKALLWLPAVLLITVVWTLHGTVGVMLNAERRNGWVLVLGVWAAMFRTFLPALAVVVLGVSVGHLLLGLTLAACLALLGVGWVAWRVFGEAARRPGSEQARWRGELRQFDLTSPLLGLAMWLMEGVDRWLLVGRRGAEGGEFALAFVLGLMAFTLVAGIILQAGFPVVYRRIDEARTAADRDGLVQLCDRMLVGYLGLGALAVLVLTYLGPFLTRVGLIGADFAGAWVWLWPAASAAAFPRLLQFHGQIFSGLRRLRPMLPVTWGLAGAKAIFGLLALLHSVEAFALVLLLSTPVAALIGRWHLVRCYRALVAADATVAR